VCAFRDPDRGEGKGHVQTFVFGQRSSTPEGAGEVTCLVSGVCTTYSIPLGPLWVSTSLDK